MSVELMLKIFLVFIGICVILVIGSEVVMLLALGWRTIKDILDL